MRLDRYLRKELQLGSNKVRALLASGDVQLNQRVQLTGAVVLGNFDQVMVRNQILQNQTPRYLMLNKPAGVVSATVDENHQTVIDFITEPWAQELHLAGRLDRFTTGLVILTNDGTFSEALSRPEQKVGKRYLVETNKQISKDMIESFEEGMWFEKESIKTTPAQVHLLNESCCRLTIYEGKHHQVKRMFARFGTQVTRLHREAIGDYEIGNLEEGLWTSFVPYNVARS